MNAKPSALIIMTPPDDGPMEVASVALPAGADLELDVEADAEAPGDDPPDDYGR